MFLKSPGQLLYSLSLSTLDLPAAWILVIRFRLTTFGVLGDPVKTYHIWKDMVPVPFSLTHGCTMFYLISIISISISLFLPSAVNLNHPCASEHNSLLPRQFCLSEVLSAQFLHYKSTLFPLQEITTMSQGEYPSSHLLGGFSI